MPQTDPYEAAAQAAIKSKKPVDRYETAAQSAAKSTRSQFTPAQLAHLTRPEDESRIRFKGQDAWRVTKTPSGFIENKLSVADAARERGKYWQKHGYYPDEERSPKAAYTRLARTEKKVRGVVEDNPVSKAILEADENMPTWLKAVQSLLPVPGANPAGLIRSVTPAVTAPARMLAEGEVITSPDATPTQRIGAVANVARDTWFSMGTPGMGKALSLPWSKVPPEAKRKFAAMASKIGVKVNAPMTAEEAHAEMSRQMGYRMGDHAPKVTPPVNPGAAYTGPGAKKATYPAPEPPATTGASAGAIGAEETLLTQAQRDAFNPAPPVAPSPKPKKATKPKMKPAPLQVVEGGEASALTKAERATVHSLPYDVLSDAKAHAERIIAASKPGTAEYKRAADGLRIIEKRIADRAAQHPIPPTTDVEGALKESLFEQGKKVLGSRPATGGLPRGKGKGRPGMAMVVGPDDVKTLGARAGAVYDEATKISRLMRLGGDVGSLLRQGGEMLANDPKQWWKSLREGMSHADLKKVEAYRAKMDGEVIHGRSASQVEREAGLKLSDFEGEEAFASKLIHTKVGQKLGAGKVEAFQTVFLDSGRQGRFRSFMRKFPDASEQELKDMAAYINSAMGKSNMDKVPMLAEKLMTAPRWSKSRWEMAARVANAPLGTTVKALKGNRAAQQELKNIGRYAATLYGVTKIAEQAGYTVDYNPKSADFLKLRKGNQVFDIASGVAAPIRTVLRIFLMAKDAHDGKNPGTNTPGTELGKVASNYANPLISTLWGKYTGKSLSMHDLDDEDKGMLGLMFIIIGGTKKAYDEDGPAAAATSGFWDFLGASSQRYPKPKRKGGGAPTSADDLMPKVPTIDDLMPKF